MWNHRYQMGWHFFMDHATEENCAKPLIEEMFLRYWALRKTISDNGVQCINDLMQKVTYSFRICTLFNPVERKTGISKLCSLSWCKTNILHSFLSFGKWLHPRILFHVTPHTYDDLWIVCSMPSIMLRKLRIFVRNMLTITVTRTKASHKFFPRRDGLPMSTYVNLCPLKSRWTRHWKISRKWAFSLSPYWSYNPLDNCQTQTASWSSHEVKDAVARILRQEEEFSQQTKDFCCHRLLLC